MTKKLTIFLLGLFLPTLAKAQTVNLDLSTTAAPFGQASQDASVLYGRDGNVLRQIGVTAAGELKTSGTIIPAYVTVNVESIVTVNQGAPGSAPWPVADTRTADAVERTYGATTQTAQNTADLLEIFKVLDLQTALGSDAYDDSLLRVLTSSKVEAWGNSGLADAVNLSSLAFTVQANNNGPLVGAIAQGWDDDASAWETIGVTNTGGGGSGLWMNMHQWGNVALSDGGALVDSPVKTLVGGNVRAFGFAYDPTANDMENMYILSGTGDYDASNLELLTRSNLVAQHGVDLAIPFDTADLVAGWSQSAEVSVPRVASVQTGFNQGNYQAAGGKDLNAGAGLSMFSDLHGWQGDAVATQRYALDGGTWNDGDLLPGVWAGLMFDNGSGTSQNVRTDHPLPVQAPNAIASSLANATTATFTLANGKLLQNYTLTAKWNGSVTIDTFTATLEGSPTGAFSGEEVVLATVTQATSGLTANAQLKPYAYTRVNLSALTLVTADSLDLYATGLQ